jgi:hypothetical protein
MPVETGFHYWSLIRRDESLSGLVKFLMGTLFIYIDINERRALN